MINRIFLILFVAIAVLYVDNYSSLFDKNKEKKTYTKYLVMALQKDDDLNKILNDLSKDGWKVSTTYENKIILEKNYEK